MATPTRLTAGASTCNHATSTAKANSIVTPPPTTSTMPMTTVRRLAGSSGSGSFRMLRTMFNPADRRLVNHTVTSVSTRPSAAAYTRLAGSTRSGTWRLTSLAITSLSTSRSPAANPTPATTPTPAATTP